MENLKIYEVWDDHNIYPCNKVKFDGDDITLFAPNINIHVKANKKAIKWTNEQSFEVGGHDYVVIY